MGRGKRSFAVLVYFKADRRFLRPIKQATLDGEADHGHAAHGTRGPRRRVLGLASLKLKKR